MDSLGDVMGRVSAAGTDLHDKAMGIAYRLAERVSAEQEGLRRHLRGTSQEDLLAAEALLGQISAVVSGFFGQVSEIRNDIEEMCGRR